MKFESDDPFEFLQSLKQFMNKSVPQYIEKKKKQQRAHTVLQ